MIDLDPDAVWSHEEPPLCNDTWKSLEGPTLSNDIWNKFGLLLTPPRTPSRDTDLDLGNHPVDLNFVPLDLSFLDGDNLEVDLDSFDLDARLPSELKHILPPDFVSGVACSHGQVVDTCSSCEKLALAGSELRHDCMWVGTCTAEAHANQHRFHSDSKCSHYNDLMDSQRSLEAVAGFTQLDDADDDDHLEPDDDDDLDYSHMSRPDTPSESSETDTEDECETDRIDHHSVSHEEEVYSSGSPSTTGLVHIDHTYHLPTTTTQSSSVRPSPKPSASFLHTPSDTEEDEIDVVSVGSNANEAAAACNNNNSKRKANNNSRNKSASSKKSRRDVVLSCTADGTKKVFRIHTSSLPSSPSGKVKKRLQEVVAEGIKHKARRSGRGSSTPKSSKRHHAREETNIRKRIAHKHESDDPDKREMHNSLERMRRVDLRNAFNDLRVLIPDLVEKEKAPKVEILKKASVYCRQIQKQEQTLEALVEKEKKYKNSLLKRLHSLQRQSRN
ncbi:hypothetical protein SK128_010182 [Halocaridina rubra]|uniref:BHLH domain-containing protein n=1 Tax=Halocaridina rubra TaxID=373956 RepID=A0AAN8XE08_HALRR